MVNYIYATTRCCGPTVEPSRVHRNPRDTSSRNRPASPTIGRTHRLSRRRAARSVTPARTDRNAPTCESDPGKRISEVGHILWKGPGQRTRDARTPGRRRRRPDYSNVCTNIAASIAGRRGARIERRP